MFCNKCGEAMNAGVEHCPRCGATAGVGVPHAYTGLTNTFTQSKLERRIPVVAVLWIIYGVLETLRAAAVQFFLHLSRWWVAGPDWSNWAGPWVLGWIVAWSLFSAVLAFLAAWGLYERRLWGRSAAIAAAIFAILHPPFGTILGIYTLVLLLSNNAADEYVRSARI